MIIHLRNRGGALDFADTKTLLTERDQEWDASEIPTMYFNRVEKAMQQLTRAGITSDLQTWHSITSKAQESTMRR